MNVDEKERKEREGGRKEEEKRKIIYNLSTWGKKCKCFTIWVICNVLHTLVTPINTHMESWYKVMAEVGRNCIGSGQEHKL